MMCLEKDRTRRYATANGLAMDVQRHLNSEPVIARPPSATYRISRWIRRSPAVTGLVALLVLAVAVAMILGTLMNVRLTQSIGEADRANQRLSETIRFLESERMEERAAEGWRSQPLAWLARRAREMPRDRVAAARLLSMLTRCSYALPVFAPLQHEGAVHTAAFSPDGREIMTAAEDGKVRFWDAVDGRALRVLSGEAKVAHATYVARDARLLAIGHDRVARVFDPRTSGLVFQVADVLDPVLGYCEGRDGRWLYLHHSGGRISRWDLETGARVEPMFTLPAEISRTRYSVPSDCLGVACLDGTVHILDGTRGTPLAPSRSFPPARFDIGFAPDGRRLFVSQMTGDRIAVWNFRGGDTLSEFVPSTSTTINSMLFTPDGRRLLTWTWGTGVRLWDPETTKAIGVPIDAGLHAMLVLAHGGRLAASRSHTGTTLLIDLENAETLLEPIEHDGSVTAVNFSPDDARLITGSVDGMARVWDIRMRLPQSLVLPSSTGGGTVAFNGSGTRLLTSVDPNGIQICDTRTGRPIGPILRHPRPDAHIRYAWFTPDESRVLTVGEEGLLRLWDTRTFAPSRDIAVGTPVLLAKISPDGRSIVAGGRGLGATVWSTETGEQLFTADHRGQEVVSIQFHPTAPCFITASVDGLARTWTLPDGHQVLPPLQHRGIVWSASFSPDGRWIATASADKTAQLWDADTGDRIHNPFRHTKDVYLAGFSPDARRLLTASEDGTARIWNTETGQPVTPLLRHRSRIWMGAFTPDGRTVATGSDDRTVRLWDPATGVPMSEPVAHEGPVGRLSFSPDGRQALTFGGQPRLWDVIEPPTPVPAWFCDLVEALAAQRLTDDGQWQPVAGDALGFLRKRLEKEGADTTDFYSRWAHWFLVERMRHPAPAFSGSTGAP